MRTDERSEMRSPYTGLRERAKEQRDSGVLRKSFA